jgi:hypothetical protein
MHDFRFRRSRLAVKIVRPTGNLWIANPWLRVTSESLAEVRLSVRPSVSSVTRNCAANANNTNAVYSTLEIQLSLTFANHCNSTGAGHVIVARDRPSVW